MMVAVYWTAGRVYREMRLFDQALACFSTVLEIAKAIGSIGLQAACYYDMGRTYNKLHNYNKALDYYKQSLNAYMKTGEERGQADVYNNIGNLYSSLGDNGQAMVNYKNALCIFEKFGEECKQAGVYKNIGFVFFSLGDNGQAMENYKHALCIYEKLEEEHKQAEVYNSIGLVYGFLGDNGQAMENYKHALCIHEKFGEECRQADVFGNIGVVFYSLGDGGQAMMNYKKALCIFRKFGEEHGQATAYYNIANIARFYNPVEAMELYRSALAFFQKRGNVILQAETWNNIGILYLNMSEHPEAEKSLKESLRLFELVFMNLGSLEKLKITVIETYIKTYRCLFYVSIILDKPEQALLASEQGRSRALKDSLQKKYGLESNAPSDEDTRYTSSLISEDNTSFVVICLSIKWLHLFTLASGKPLVTESSIIPMLCHFIAESGHDEGGIIVGRELSLTACFSVLNVILLAEPAEVLRAMEKVEPEFTRHPRSQTIKQGNHVTFGCAASGRPQPRITWLYNGGDALPQGSHQLSNGSLNVAAVYNNVSYEGLYTCLASSEAGMAQANASLIVDGESKVMMVISLLFCDRQIKEE
ncbi:predicted protein [Nematostella vectensis]|uniref:Ig-like domain-containing protein n=1 Tax=Nematostella vectensis TaxID=45351 RepID=A7T085_NEMVE|nr:predicted protein [Nematostella vectensis]|eukprot:XP_001622726.1 predicted protein [Nematostella vectensis]